ncbi:hypothetical protein FB2170_13041 [Maribacter sp. HTCC2170]|nr:hypothetical protein FB2170_13041 [Maribacter sp. HTCC2170]
MGYKLNLGELWECIQLIKGCYKLDDSKMFKKDLSKCSKRVIDNVNSKNVIFNWIYAHHVAKTPI